MISLRLAGAKDAEAISGLCALHAEFERAAFNPQGHFQRLAQALRGENPRILILLAEKAGLPIAYVSLVREFSTWQAREYLHMDCLFVKDSMRGLGVGRALFAAAQNEARRLGLNELQWQTPAWNADAIGFYQHLGALSVAKQRFRLKVD